MWSYVALGAALLVAAYKPLLRLLTPAGIPGIPAYPDPSPLLGDTPRFGKWLRQGGTVGSFFSQCGKDLGVIAQIRLGWGSSTVVVADYQTTEDILTRQSGSFDRARRTADIFRGLIPNAQISLPTNDMWKHHRRIIGPAMTSKYLSLTTPRANESVKELIELWRLKGEYGNVWAAHTDMFNATMDAICGMAFGSSWGITRSSIQQVAAARSTDAALKPPQLAESTFQVFDSLPSKSPYPIISHYFARLTPTYRRNMRCITEFLMEKLEASRARAKVLGADAAEMADNTLDMMTAREVRGDWMKDTEMTDEVFQYLVAGFETSGATLSWWLKYMARYPDVQRKLRGHLLSRLPEIQDRQPTFEDLNAVNTPYLEAVVHETLRMGMTASGYAREVIKDVVILGKRVPKGTLILFSTFLGLEDRSTPCYAFSEVNASVASGIFDKARSEEDTSVQLSESLAGLRGDIPERKVGFWAPGSGHVFDPERWLDSEGRFDINAGPSLPFSLGQRGCFGKNLAMLELRSFMSQLNQAFFFAPVSEEQNSFDRYETIASHPKQCFIRPCGWDSKEAMA